jgi:peptide/nickel transport system ATP-binding protein
MSESELRQYRGRVVSYVPQDPGTALNPTLRVGPQLREVLTEHINDDPDLPDPSERMAQVLAEVRLDASREILSSYPHQLSGGQQQRIALAMAFACRPRLIVLDEPTTGLDVATQRHVLDTIRGLCSAYGVAAVYVTHDLAVVAQIADRVAVMYAGQLVEMGPTRSVFNSAAHPYTSGLLRAIPSPDQCSVLVGMEGQPPRPGRRPRGCYFAPRCALAGAECLTRPPSMVEVEAGTHWSRCGRSDELITSRTDESPIKGQIPVRSAGAGNGQLLLADGITARYGDSQVLWDVGFSLPKQSCVAVVGESGSGKTTLARCIVGLHSNWSGTVAFNGARLKPHAHNRDYGVLKSIQYIFQSPYSSLNPRKTIAQILEQPLTHFFQLSRREALQYVESALQEAALSDDFLRRYPEELSGGERQRVAIARALIVEPELLVCDEVTSALDVSVQAAIVELLRRLQNERGLSLLFITHNLALVRSIAQYVVVLHEGRVVEAGETEEVLTRPQDAYTQLLLEDIPKLWEDGIAVVQHSLTKNRV